ncbi:hypothetical protein JXA47_12390 [Candidatus Sumerlaeota bacterium]|nr:hypothetical protein [Candidatus Sumerlaeota bacterium]
MALALALVIASQAVPVTVAGVAFDTDNAAQDAVLTTDGTLSTSFFSANVSGGTGSTDPDHHVGTMLGGSPSNAVDMTSATSGSTGRNHITLTWGTGRGVQNQAGVDIHVYESATVNSPTEMFPECFGLAVREAGSSTFSGFRYQHVEAGDVAANKTVTSFDLSDFGIAAGAWIDAVQIISMHNENATTSPYLEDRVDSATGEGNLTLDAGSGSGFRVLQGPLSGNAGTSFPDSAMDVDIVYVVATNADTIPGPATTGYLYYAGGVVATSGDAIEGLDFEFDSAPTADLGVFSVLQARVDITAGTVTNWRRMSSLLPEDDPNTGGTTEAYTYLYMENAVNVHGNYLYVGPGDWNGDGLRTTAAIVAYAEIIDEFGNLGPFEFSAPFPSPPAEQAICPGRIAEIDGNAYYYVMGGNYNGGVGYDRVIFAPINPDGSLGAWTTTTALPSGDWFNGATVVGSTIIHGSGNLRSPAGRVVDYATPATDGTIAAWSSGGTYDSSDTTNRWAYAMAAASAGGTDFAIIAGGTGPTPNPAVHTAPVVAGVPGTWTQTNDLPVPKRQLTAAGMDDMIVVLGGSDAAVISNLTDAVQIGRIDASGVITWTLSPTPMLHARGWGGAAFYRTEFPATTAVESYQLYR